MISLTNIEPDVPTDANARNSLLAEAGVTQATVAASVAASRAAGSAAIADSLNKTPLGTNPGAHLNPLHIDGSPKANYMQPNSSNPTPTAATVQVENVKNPLRIVAALPVYSQPGVAAPPAPVAGQLSTLSYGSIGVSKITLADGSTRST